MRSMLAQAPRNRLVGTAMLVLLATSTSLAQLPSLTRNVGRDSTSPGAVRLTYKLGARVLAMTESEIWGGGGAPVEFELLYAGPVETDSMFLLADRLVFWNEEPLARRELYTTNGTADGTSLLFRESSGVASSAGFDPPAQAFHGSEQAWVASATGQASTNEAAFAAIVRDQGERRLLVTDGTSEGTRLLGLPPAVTYDLSAWRDHFVLVTRDDNFRHQIWLTDGQSEPLSVGEPFDPGLIEVIPLGDRLLLRHNPVGAKRLLRFDPLTSETEVLFEGDTAVLVERPNVVVLQDRSAAVRTLVRVFDRGTPETVELPGELRGLEVLSHQSGSTFLRTIPVSPDELGFLWVWNENSSLELLANLCWFCDGNTIETPRRLLVPNGSSVLSVDPDSLELTVLVDEVQALNLFNSAVPGTPPETVYLNFGDAIYSLDDRSGELQLLLSTRLDETFGFLAPMSSELLATFEASPEQEVVWRLAPNSLEVVRRFDSDDPGLRGELFSGGRETALLIDDFFLDNTSASWASRGTPASTTWFDPAALCNTFPRFLASSQTAAFFSCAGVVLAWADGVLTTTSLDLGSDGFLFRGPAAALGEQLIAVTFDAGEGGSWSVRSTGSSEPLLQSSNDYEIDRSGSDWALLSQFVDGDVLLSLTDGTPQGSGPVENPESLSLLARSNYAEIDGAVYFWNDIQQLIRVDRETRQAAAFLLDRPILSPRRILIEVGPTLIASDARSLFEIDTRTGTTIELEGVLPSKVEALPSGEVLIQLWAPGQPEKSLHLARPGGDLQPILTPSGDPMSARSGVALADGRAVFSGALLGSSDFEPWIYQGDGTARLLADIRPGPRSSRPGSYLTTDSHLFFLADDGIHGYELFSMPLDAVDGRCRATDFALCLLQERFQVEVAYRVGEQAPQRGRTIDLSSDTGGFWFFNPENVELLTKTLDGRGVNDFFWQFSGALTDVEYELTVTDAVTGLAKRYYNAPGVFASSGDTRALPGDPAEAFETLERGRAGVATPTRRSSASTAPCTADTTTLCLADGRFEATVTWTDFSGNSGTGSVRTVTDDTGAFWFFDAANLELLVKVLDGTEINGRYWVFYGALSNVAFELGVRDTTTGQVVVYENPLGRFASRGDTNAFPTEDSSVP